MTSDYLLIASRDPFASNAVPHLYELASGLAREGRRVALFLVQNGVLAAREGLAANALSELARSGVRVWADDFSLRERGIARERLTEGVEPAPLERVIDALAEGTKTLWH